jgi:hypothetical protein
MKIILVSLVLMFGAAAAQADNHIHREHGAHVHGSATLAMAFDGNQGSVEFKSPADSVLGFEHAANSAADKKKMAEVYTIFETKISEMVSLDTSLHCQFHKDKLDTVFASANHADVIATFSLKCAKSPAGTTVKFYFQKYFPALKDVDAQFIVDNLQKSLEIKTNGTNLDLR